MRGRTWCAGAIAVLAVACASVEDSGLFRLAPTNRSAATADDGPDEGGRGAATNGAGGNSTAAATPPASGGGEESERGGAAPVVVPPLVDENPASGGGDGVRGSGDADAGGTGSGSEGARPDAGDGSAGSGDAGVAADDDQVPVDGSILVQPSCPFASCGGELDGAYDYVGACVEEAGLFAGLFAGCEEAQVLSADGRIAGSSSFAGSVFTQDVTLTFSLVFRLPAACVPGGCALTAEAYVEAGATGTNCEAAAEGACTCTMPLSSSAQVSTTFTRDGDQVTLGETTVSYCAADGDLVYTNGVDDFDYVLRAVER